jgi:hypothetical protein
MQDRKSWSERMLEIYRDTFPPEGYDTINETHNGHPVSSNPTVYNKYFHDPFTMVTSFFGLPNNRIAPETKSKVSNLLYNLIGYQRKASDDRKMANSYKIIPTLLFNIAVACVKTVWNTLTIFTELLPKWFATTLECLAEQAADAVEQKNKENKPLAAVGYLALGLLAASGSLLFNLVGFVGGAFTSPKENPRRAYKWCTSKFPGIGGKILGGVMAALSLSITITWAILAVTFLAPIAMPYIVANSPAFIAPVVNAVVGAFSTAATSLTAGLVSIGVTGIATSLSTFALTAATTLGLVGAWHGIDKLWESAKNAWFQTRMKAASVLPIASSIALSIGSSLYTSFGMGEVISLGAKLVSHAWNGLRSLFATSKKKEVIPSDISSNNSRNNSDSEPMNGSTKKTFDSLKYNNKQKPIKVSDYNSEEEEEEENKLLNSDLAGKPGDPSVSVNITNNKYSFNYSQKNHTGTKVESLEKTQTTSQNNSPSNSN